jgi:hypothetical protein
LFRPEKTISQKQTPNSLSGLLWKGIQREDSSTCSSPFPFAHPIPSAGKGAVFLDTRSHFRMTVLSENMCYRSQNCQPQRTAYHSQSLGVTAAAVLLVELCSTFASCTVETTNDHRRNRLKNLFPVKLYRSFAGTFQTVEVGLRTKAHQA